MDSPVDPKKPYAKPPHYYGDIVRILFMSAAVILLIGLPAIKQYLHLPSIFSVLFILILGFAAGLTNPKLLWDSGLNMIVAIIGFIITESYAVWAYSYYPATNQLLITTMVLGLIFIFAVYFSVKTFRGLWLDRQGKQELENNEDKDYYED